MVVIITLPDHSQNARERIQNNVQLSQSKQVLERDMKELELFKIKTAGFEAAVDTKDTTKLEELTTSIGLDMLREIEQLSVKKSQARREIRQSTAEIGAERREIQDNREDSENGWGDYDDDRNDMARDRANKMDDQKDRMDDIKDALTLDKILENAEKILAGVGNKALSYGYCCSASHSRQACRYSVY